MNFFEWEIKKYERRIRIIRERPDPTKLKANLLLYEVWLDYRRQQIRDWEAGKPFVYVTMSAPTRLFTAMGLNAIHLLVTGDRSTDQMTTRYFQLARDHGFPDHVCDRVQVGAGLGLSGDLPAPAFCVGNYTECVSGSSIIPWMAQHYGVPAHVTCVPPEDSREALEYVTAQFRDLVEHVLATVPSARFNEKALARQQEMTHESQRFLHEMLELRKAVPCPMSGRDGLRMPPLIEDPRMIDYYKLASQELREKAERKIGSVKEERARVMWLASAPFYDDPFSFLESRGIAVPLYEDGPGVAIYAELPTDEEFFRKYGRRPRNGLEREAFWSLQVHWAGPAERRINEVLLRCEQFNIDGLVHYQLAGCPSLLGSSRLLAQRAETELGIPSVMIDGWCQDREKYDRSAMSDALAEFAEVVIAEKARRAKRIHCADSFISA